MLRRIWNPGIQEKTEGFKIEIPSWLPGLKINSIFIILGLLADDAEDVVLAHDQKSIAIDLDFSAAVFRAPHFVSLFHGEIDLLALFVHLARAESDHFALLRFFFG